MPQSIEAAVKPVAQVTSTCLMPKRPASQPTGAVSDRCRDNVGGENPADLIQRCRETALHIGQRHVGDRDVECLHDEWPSSRTP